MGSRREFAQRSLRLLVYLWAGPTSSVGLLFVALALLSGGRVRRHSGVLECHGGVVSLLLRRCTPVAGGASAIALGHVVLGQTERALSSSRLHERVHVGQAERWGLLFLPAYVGASVAAMARGEHYYYGNAFERAAYEAEQQVEADAMRSTCYSDAPDKPEEEQKA